MDKLSPATSLFALIGHPVNHSKSPRLFNQIFQHEKMDQVYLAFDNQNAKALIESMRHLNIKGYSVTVPHKEAAFRLVDKCDYLATSLKSVNTIVNKDGILTGYNTDGIGAIETIENYETHAHDLNQKVNLGDWKIQTITFLGSGGAARGIALSMLVKYNFKGVFHFVARNEEKTKPLIEDIVQHGGTAKFFAWNDLGLKTGIIANIIINTTTIGMQSSSTASQSPISKEQFLSIPTKSIKPVVFDIVYTPLDTPLLKLATECGLDTIDGLDMFLSQANYQLELWTGKKLPLSLLRLFY